MIKVKNMGQGDTRTTKSLPYSLRLSKLDKQMIKELSRVLSMTAGEVIILGINSINNTNIKQREKNDSSYKKVLKKVRPSSIRLSKEDILIIREKKEDMERLINQSLTTRELIIIGLNSIDIKKETEYVRKIMIKEFLKSKGLE